MRRRLFGVVIALGGFAAGPVLAQPVATIETMVGNFVETTTIGLPAFIVEATHECFLATVNGLEETDHKVMLAAPDFIAGINALAAAKPEIPETLFPALDSCAGTMTAGEIMWVWVLAEWDQATEEEQITIGTCLLGAIDRLVIEAKRGITTFGLGEFPDAIAAMLIERQDLAGNIVEDLAACGVDAAFFVQGPPIAQDAEREVARWGYQGEEGPPHWGDLDEEFALCEAGRNQSPINIPSGAALTTASLQFSYGESQLHIVNNGHTIQVNYDQGSVLSIDGKEYGVAQFHFHSPSEHTIEGVAAAFVMHVVHVADDGALAFVGVLFDVGEDDNPFLAEFWRFLPDEGIEFRRSTTINVAAAFDTGGGLFSYGGSLTTPPCSEDVAWFVTQEHQTISKGQLGEFVSIVGLNARPVQPLNGRAIGGAVQ